MITWFRLRDKHFFQSLYSCNIGSSPIFSSYEMPIVEYI